MTKHYTVKGTSTTLFFARKDTVVKAADQLGESAVVLTPAGKVVHTVTVEVAPVAVKVCKKDASHGPHRVTKTGSYCYTCDRIVAEAQKAARAAAKQAAVAA